MRSSNKAASAELTVVYTSEDGTVYDSTDGWRIESYGSDKVLAREIGGTLDAEIAEGKNRTEILIASREAIARLVRSGVRTTTQREFEDRLAAAHHLLGACRRKAGGNLDR
jgi:hypothetical protein